MTKTTRTIGTITIASRSIRTIGAIVKICKRFNGNHSRMTRTIEAIQMYPKMHRFFQNSTLFLNCVPKSAPKLHNKHEKVATKLLHQCMVQKVAKPINKNNKINPQSHTSLCIVFFFFFFFFKKRIAQSIDYLWDFTLCFTGLPPKNVASRGPNRAVSLFETIEAIIWKPKIASIAPIVRIASKHF